LSFHNFSPAGEIQGQLFSDDGGFSDAAIGLVLFGNNAGADWWPWLSGQLHGMRSR
jgi:hypothetical protein